MLLTHSQSPFCVALHLLVLPHKAMLLFLPVPGLVADGLYVLLILATDPQHLSGHGYYNFKACCCLVGGEVCSDFDEYHSLQETPCLDRRLGFVFHPHILPLELTVIAMLLYTCNDQR